MRKAVIEVGKYVAKEGPTGGWHVFIPGVSELISVHETQAEAVAAAKRYLAADKRRAA